METPFAREQPDLNYAVQHPTADAPSGLMCPECGGALWERWEDGVIQYRCHVGHVLSLETMVAAQGEALEMALWNAVRALRERAALLRRVVEPAFTSSLGFPPTRATEEADELDQQANLIRGLLLRQGHSAS